MYPAWGYYDRTALLQPLQPAPCPTSCLGQPYHNPLTILHANATYIRSAVTPLPRTLNRRRVIFSC